MKVFNEKVQAWYFIDSAGVEWLICSSVDTAKWGQRQFTYGTQPINPAHTKSTVSTTDILGTLQEVPYE